MQEVQKRADWLVNEKGWPPEDVPKLTKSAGRMWFRRWRIHYNITYRITDMQLKVPWTKIRRRVRCFLGNIWRLRAFWEMCHPGTPMRFLSLDQKPAWFNNAGIKKTYTRKGGRKPTVRENYHQMKDRYTILTSVPFNVDGSQATESPSMAASQVTKEPPKVAVLFKGKPHGHIFHELEDSDILTPWMKVQVQRNGSYRSEDMVEALDWLLPTATKPEESVVVLLDWYSRSAILLNTWIFQRRQDLLKKWCQVV